MSKNEFYGLSWYEFNCAAEGYFTDLRQRLGIPDKSKPEAPTDQEREEIKAKTDKWMKFFKRPTLKTVEYG